MANRADKERIRALLSEAITVLCKNGLGYELEFSVEGLLGITVDKEDIFLVNIKESVLKGQDSQKNGHEGKNNSEYADQNENLSFSSTLEGVTGEFIEVGQVQNNNNHNNSNNNNNKRQVERHKSVDSHNHVAARHHPTMGSAIKVEQGEPRPGKDTQYEGPGSAGATSQTTILAGDLVLSASPWEQNLTVSQAVAVSAPLVAASMSQMTGIAQPTQEWFMRESMRLSAQLEEQRRRSREHMRRYRQQLRATNYSEYEDRKRRQREGMRRYRERLRVENPEKYAEMNRKHAEQERRRRMRVRSLSASFVQQASAHSPLQVAMQAGGSSSGGGVDGTGTGKLGTTDFLHMAMENSQLLPVRDMHQLIQSGFPLATAGGTLGMAAGNLSVSAGPPPPGSVSLPPSLAPPVSVTLTSGAVGGGGGGLASLTQGTVEDLTQPQQQPQQPQVPSSHPNTHHTLSAMGRDQQAGGGLVQSTTTLPAHTLPGHSQVIPPASTQPSSSVTVSSLPTTSHHSQGLQTMAPSGLNAAPSHSQLALQTSMATSSTAH